MGDAGGTKQDLKFFQPTLLCTLRVLCGGSSPTDWVRLIRHTGCRESTRRLVGTREVYFSFLPPGDYLLTQCACQGRLDLWVHPSPGSTVECRLCPASRQFSWCRLPCPYWWALSP